MIVASNGEAAACSGRGVGHMLGRGGAASWRGAQFCFSSGQTLGKLNGIATLTIKLYEWK